ncbi:ferredoxin [Candidatus Vecturithrix granuli]|uniref:Ferredoxin n=1 Tax=Vecturithrix granuli TaxID=1499967 RepID=A0A0S6W958_VECG1|nr:ferredoxin [Candidatus Vecturithrix granuli]
MEKDSQSFVMQIVMTDGEHRISFLPGLSIHEILASTPLRLRSACGGIGICGQCLVGVEAGCVNDPTPNELHKLASDQLAQGMRLACQVRPCQNVRIRIERSVPQASWRSLLEDEYTPFDLSTQSISTSTQKHPSYGVAVDLGTTQIRLSLWDMKKKQRLAGRVGLNPQSCFGTDVLTRLVNASESPDRMREIGGLARDAIGGALRDMLSEGGWNSQAIGHIMIVGNSAMLALLAERNAHLLLHPEYWMREINCQPDDTDSWRRSWECHESAVIEIVQPLAGFVGSDLLAGVLATQLTQGAAGSLLIDFGTNSEIALWDGMQLWVTSAAGGPAFEGWGISCGMPAEPGAIYRADHRGDSSNLQIEVIGGGQACGVCGSGLVDIIGSLCQSGELKRNGLFTGNLGHEGFCILKGSRDIVLYKQDVDMFQRAKAAIGAGITCLLKQADLYPREIRRVCVCGAFGRFLNVSNAQAIGLLPGIAPEHVELCGNTALAGAEMLLCSDNTSILKSLRRKARIINMSSDPIYENLFIEHLYLQPISMD